LGQGELTGSGAESDGSHVLRFLVRLSFESEIVTATPRHPKGEKSEIAKERKLERETKKQSSGRFR